MKICQVCLSFLKGERGRENYENHHLTVAELLNSVEERWYFCYELCGTFRDEILGKIETWDRDGGDRGVFITCRCIPVPRHSNFEGWPQGTCYFELDMPEDVPYREFEAELKQLFPLWRTHQPGLEWFLVPQPETRGANPERRMSTETQHSMQLASYWLQECNEFHRGCQKQRRSAPSWSPTRLIDVRKAGTITLVDSIDTRETVRYNTLSHRWGDSELFKLDAGSLQTLKSGVDEKVLSNVFQDAVKVTRAQAVPYLWIDSLCIKQDDDNDWLAESIRMGDIYSSAYCNIAATVNSPETGGLAGFNRVRDPTDIAPAGFCVPSFWNSSHLSKGKYRVISRDYDDNALFTGPLNKRGWVFQERFLSRRSLHFTANELIWECKEFLASESWPQGIPGPHDKRFKNLDNLNRTLRDCRYSLRGEAGWREIIRLYSNTTLTYAEDRTMAIAGVAKRFQQNSGDKYILGMWESTLLTDLLWMVGGSSGSRVHTKSRHFHSTPPSFSWLSLESAVLASYCMQLENLAEVVKLHLEYLTDDNTGPVRRGQLYLRGFLCEIQLVQNDEWTEETEYESYWKVYFDGKELDASSYPDFGRENLPRETANQRHFFLPIGRLKYDSTDSIKLEGLILELIDLSTLSFRRVGMSELSCRPGEKLSDLEVSSAEQPLHTSLYDPQTAKHIVCIH